MSEEHPADLTKALQGLVAKGFLQQDGQRRWTSYRLPALPGQTDRRLSHKGVDSSHKADSSHKEIEDWSHKLEEIPAEEVAKLKMIAAPAFHGSRLEPNETRKIILALCDGHFLTAADLGELMARNARGLRDRFLSPMVDEGLLTRKYPEEPNRPDQAYTLKKK